MPNQRDATYGFKSNLVVSLARSGADVIEAQRLRYKVFADEIGARLASADEGLDRDIFDPYCEHLLVRDLDTNEVVGTYRILTSEQAERVGAFYSETEFDLANILPLTPRLVEVGRSCVHPDYRQGATIALLWAGLADYMLSRGYEYLIGCASISLADGHGPAVQLYERLRAAHLSPDEWRVFPRHPLPLLETPLPESVGPVQSPPLIKGYLRLGAYICGDPAWDPEFNAADLLVLLPMSRMNPRYARHFLGKVCV
jgi:putative hemolysin